jgi:hypothetical protein
VNAWESLAASGVVSLLAGEFTELGPWLARRVIRLSTRLLADRRLAEQFGEKWLAGIDGTPGKLTPLARATGILFITVPVLDYRYLDDWWACTVWLPIAAWNFRGQLKMPRVTRYAVPRSERKRYNEALTAVCRALAIGSAAERAEALETLQLLVSDPPPWTLKWFARGLQRDLTRLQTAFTSRGYLT